MENTQDIHFDANFAKKTLGILLEKYLSTLGEKLSEEELEAVLSALIEYSQKNILELHIYKKFTLDVKPEIPEGLLYFHRNSISLTVQEAEDTTNDTTTEIPIIGDTALVCEGNVYTIYSISIPITRVINILTGILLDQASASEELLESQQPGAEALEEN